MLMRIGGEETEAASGAWLDVINPATGEVLDRVPAGGKEVVDAAVAAAEQASAKWAAMSPRERGKILFHAAGAIREARGELARTLTREQGKPLPEAVDEVRGCANVLEFFASVSGCLSGDFIRLGAAGDGIVVREPLGVCGAIVPWNMPVILMGWKAGPALVAGNTFVLKPSSTTPLTTLAIAGLMEKAGLPPGVLNVVTGTGETAGRAIVAHPGIRKVSFTGNTATGLAVRQAAAPLLKEVTLELGGSDPMIVWRDADLPKAVDGALHGRFYNAGQVCNAVKRVYVHEEIASRFTEELLARVRSLKVGDGLSPSVNMGPIQNRAQLDRVAAQVDQLRERGEGRILSGGSRLRGPEHDRGFFYAPTLVTEPDPGAAILSEEVFGPVLPVMAVPDLETAITEANRSRYGLGASVWTRDLGVARAVFDRVQAGVVWVNRHLTVPPEIPFGGVKESGLGRENGVQAISRWTRAKSLFLGW
ncbi:MAG TPA: aldehyde dehydrogenase family protein [Methanomicrobiales archaeon]|jgi:succinate-semialdehyde dehydrogenase/glutarate-semialdehyde dehydrogenase|nr:aldehyde dehydrogenase family protein [Methanomicrobiales archaeon]